MSREKKKEEAIYFYSQTSVDDVSVPPSVFPQGHHLTAPGPMCSEEAECSSLSGPDIGLVGILC